MSTYFLVPSQPGNLEKLRGELAAAKLQYEEARKIADHSATADSDANLAACLRALGDYNAATTRYSNALIRDTERILRKAAESETPATTQSQVVG